jgi:hypothetical protein
VIRADLCAQKHRVCCGRRRDEVADPKEAAAEVPESMRTDADVTGILEHFCDQTTFSAPQDEFCHLALEEPGAMNQQFKGVFQGNCQPKQSLWALFFFFFLKFSFLQTNAHLHQGLWCGKGEGSELEPQLQTGAGWLGAFVHRLGCQSTPGAPASRWEGRCFESWNRGFQTPKWHDDPGAPGSALPPSTCWGPGDAAGRDAHMPGEG